MRPVNGKKAQTAGGGLNDMAQKTKTLDMEKLIGGSNKEIPVTYIRTALRDGKNIAIIGADTTERALFAKSLLTCLPHADILLPANSSKEAILQYFPERTILSVDFRKDDDGMHGGLLFLDEAECRNIRHTLPKMLLYHHENDVHRQTISVFDAENNKQAIARVSKMLAKDSIKYNFKQSSRIICRLLCEVCILVRTDGSGIVVSEIWENRTELSDIKQEMVLLHTDRGYFRFPEEAGIFAD